MCSQYMVLLRLLCSIIILLNFNDDLVLKATASPIFLKFNCSNVAFPRNSSYYLNLRDLLSSLASNTDIKTHTNPLFSDITVSPSGTTENTVYGQYICQGDYSQDECNSCVSNAATHLAVMNCSRSSSGYIWYEGCTLSFSNVSFQFNDVYHPFSNLIWFEEKNSKLMAANETYTMEAFIVKTIRELVEQVAKFDNDVAEIQWSSLGSKYFGTKEVEFVISGRVNITLYEMVQCSPDLSVRDCSNCLTLAVNELVNYSKGGLGGRVGLLNCFIRYETSRFYKLIEDLDLFPSPPLNFPPNISKGRIKIKVVIAIITPVSVVLALGIAGIAQCARKATSNKALISGVGDGDSHVIESYQYKISEIKAATNDFSNDNKIGQGGFGSVYKGVLQSGQLIAVKKLFLRFGQMEEKFKNEAEVVAKLQHRNLVRLLGYCLAKDAKLLVFEYVPNKSLDKVLFATPRRHFQMDWSMRFNIIVGIARGLLYLHEESRLKIVHRDLKPGNILLDEEMNPKIADFGLARIFGLNQTQSVATNTNTMQNYGVDPTHESTRRGGGTLGYMAPECTERGQFSVKTDVYSFGVLILEIISGKRNKDFYLTGLAEDLLSYAWLKWEAGSALELVDRQIRFSVPYFIEGTQQQVLTCIHMGLLCVQRDAKARPTIGTIVHKLNYPSNSSLPPPQQPATIDYLTRTMICYYMGEQGCGQGGARTPTWFGKKN